MLSHNWGQRILLASLWGHISATRSVHIKNNHSVHVVIVASSALFLSLCPLKDSTSFGEHSWGREASASLLGLLGKNSLLCSFLCFQLLINYTTRLSVLGAWMPDCERQGDWNSQSKSIWVGTGAEDPCVWRMNTASCSWAATAKLCIRFSSLLEQVLNLRCYMPVLPLVIHDYQEPLGTNVGYTPHYLSTATRVLLGNQNWERVTDREAQNPLGARKTSWEKYE